MTAGLSLVLALALVGAETDPYYGWFHPPHDGTIAINRAVNASFERALVEVNRAPPRTCRDAAVGLFAPLAGTAAWFFAGSTRAWRVDRVPRSNREYNEQFRSESVYRDAPLLPFGSLVPLDPTVRVGPVLFGTDKLGHFFTNGVRYYDRFLAARAAGASDDDAVRAAVLLGVSEESGGLGLSVSSIFSYADLEANDRGLSYLRALCDERAPGLALVDGRWVLRAPFDIARFVDPCWDEGYSPSAFAPTSGAAVRSAVAALCPAWRASPAIAQRRAQYRRVGCASPSLAMFPSLIADERAPDPSPWSIDAICAERGAAR